ncbi:nodal homolog [Gastrophryne carolinensis]
MAVYFFCILTALLIPGIDNVSVKTFFTNTSASLQDYANRTEPADSRNTDSPQLPNLMMSLYQSFHRFETRQGKELGPAMLQTSPSSPQADIIRSLAVKEFEQVGDRCSLVFDLSSLNQEEELQFAEVKFGKSVLANPPTDGMTMQVDIFHQDSTCQDPSGLCQNYVYLGSSTLETRSSESWLVVEATAIVHKWFEKNEEASAKKPVSSIPKENTPGPENSKRRNIKHKTENQQVLMIVYSNMSKKEKSSVTATLLLDAAQSKYLAAIPFLRNKTASRRWRRSHMIRDRIIGIQPAAPSENNKNLCRRVDLIVDFKMIGWDSWIIHPKKFNAYRCEGTCPSPVNESVKPNNHSYLQSLVNLYKRGKVPEVCCVPIRMSSLSMAYYDNKDITFQSHESMIVEECGCQ